MEYFQKDAFMNSAGSVALVAVDKIKWPFVWERVLSILMW